MSTRPRPLGLAARRSCLVPSDVPAAQPIVHTGRLQPHGPRILGHLNVTGLADPWYPALIEELRVAAGATFRYPAGAVGSYQGRRLPEIESSFPGSALTFPSGSLTFLLD